MYELKSIKSE